MITKSGIVVSSLTLTDPSLGLREWKIDTRDNNRVIWEPLLHDFYLRTQRLTDTPRFWGGRVGYILLHWPHGIQEVYTPSNVTYIDRMRTEPKGLYLDKTRSLLNSHYPFESTRGEVEVYNWDYSHQGFIDIENSTRPIPRLRVLKGIWEELIKSRTSGEHPSFKQTRKDTLQGSVTEWDPLCHAHKIRWLSEGVYVTQSCLCVRSNFLRYRKQREPSRSVSRRIGFCFVGYDNLVTKMVEG